MWPPHPTLSPAVTPSLSIQPVAGEGGSKLATACFSDAHPKRVASPHGRVDEPTSPPDNPVSIHGTRRRASLASHDPPRITRLATVAQMSPTVARDGPFRMFFFSREEERIHVHVAHPDGEAKFWLTPQIDLADHTGLSAKQLREARSVVLEHME